MADNDASGIPAQWPDWPPKPKAPPGPTVPTTEGSTAGWKDVLPTQARAPVKSEPPALPKEISPEDYDFWTTFLAHMISSRDSGVNFLQQKLGVGPSPAEKDWLKVAKQTPEGLAAMTGGLVGGLNNPVNWGIMMEVPALIEGAGEELGGAASEKLFKRIFGRSREGETVVRKITDDALRAGGLSQLSYTDQPATLASRSQQAIMAALMGIPYAMLGLTPEETSAMSASETAGPVMVEGQDIRQNVSPVFKAAARLRRMFPQGQREAADEIGHEFWKSLTKVGRHRAPKLIAEQATEKGWDWSKERGPELVRKTAEQLPSAPQPPAPLPPELSELQFRRAMRQHLLNALNPPQPGGLPPPLQVLP